MLKQSRLPILVLDAFTLLLTVGLVFLFREALSPYVASAGAQFQIDTFLFYSFSALLMLPLLRLSNMYNRRVLLRPLDQTVQIVKSFLNMAVAIIIFLFFFKNSPFTDSARGYIIGFTLLGIILLSLERTAVTYLIRKRVLLSDMPSGERILIVGAGRSGELFASQLINSPSVTIDNLIFVDDDPAKIGKNILGFPVVGSINEVESHAISHAVEKIYIVLNNVERARLLEVIELCKKTFLPLHVLSRHLGIIARNSGIDDDDALSIAQPIAIRPGMIAKRLLDVFGAGLGLFSISPVFILVALAVAVSSRGPIFYRTSRIGKGGRPFDMLKFRTMYLNNEQQHIEAAKKRLQEGKHMGKVENDPRITPIGRYLRKYSIDELPQLINVLRGDMSLVGPRPCMAYELELFDSWHKRRFHVLPGMTGLWQVTGRQIPDLALHDAMILDVYYAENWTFWLDIKILFRTVPVVLFGKGGK